MKLQELEKYEEIKEKLKKHNIGESCFDEKEFIKISVTLNVFYKCGKYRIYKNPIRILERFNKNGYRVYFEDGTRSNRLDIDSFTLHGFENNCKMEGIYWKDVLLK